MCRFEMIRVDIINLVISTMVLSEKHPKQRVGHLAARNPAAMIGMKHTSPMNVTNERMNFRGQKIYNHSAWIFKADVH